MAFIAKLQEKFHFENYCFAKCHALCLNCTIFTNIRLTIYRGIFFKAIKISSFMKLGQTEELFPLIVRVKACLHKTEKGTFCRNRNAFHPGFSSPLYERWDESDLCRDVYKDGATLGFCKKVIFSIKIYVHN